MLFNKDGAPEPAPRMTVAFTSLAELRERETSLFSWAETKTRRMEVGRVAERNNHWSRKTLSTGAPANCLAHDFVGCWWTGSGSSSAASRVLASQLGRRQLSLTRDFFFLSFSVFSPPPPAPDPAATTPLSPPPAAPPRGFRQRQKWLCCDGLASCKCQNCFVAL